MRLNDCQASVWLAQSLQPASAAFACAERVTLPEGLQESFLREAIETCQAQVPALCGRYTAAGCEPHAEWLHLATTSSTGRALEEEIDDFLVHSPTHHAGAETPLVLQGEDVCAHLLGDGVWVIRAHHIAVDGFVMFLFIGWVLRTAHALQTGGALPPYPFAAPEEDAGADSAADSAAADTTAAAAVPSELAAAWIARGVGEQAPPVLAGPHPTGGDCVSVRSTHPLPGGVDLGLLAGVVADYARSFTLHEGAWALGMPQMNRPLGTKPVAAPQVTVAPVVCLDGPWSPEATGHYEEAISWARAAGAVPIEQLRAELPRSTPAQPLTGPSMNLRPFPPTVPLPGLGVATIATLSVGPVADVEIICQTGASGQKELFLISQTTRAGRAARQELLDAHAARLAGMLAQAAEGAELLQATTRADRELLAATCGEDRAPECVTLPQMFAAQRAQMRAASLEDNPLLFFDGTWISRGDTTHLVERYAAAFAAAGLTPGDRVAVMLPRSPALMLAVAAAAACGIAWVPVDPELPAARIEHMARTTQPGAWILAASDTPGTAEDAFGGSGSHAGDTITTCGISVPALRVGVSSFDLGLPAPTAAGADLLAAAVAQVGANDEAYVLFTSGSTGLPKGVSVGQEAIANRISWQAEMLGEAVLMQKTSCVFDVSVWELLSATSLGIPTAIAPPQAHKDPVELARAIDAAGVTVCHFVPSALSVALSVWRENAPARLRTVVTSGEALERAQVDAVAEILGARTLNFYGPTEAAIDVTAAWADDSTGAVPIGRAVWRTSALVVDDEWRLTPPGGLGRLILGGVQVARGYVGDPDRTDAVFREDPIVGAPAWARGRFYDTGDLASLHGGELYYGGRRDGQVKLRGQRLETGEIAAQARAAGGVADAVVVVRDFAGQQHICAYIVPTDTSACADADAARGLVAGVREQLAATLPEYMLPSVVDLIASVPLTVSGKLDRAALPPLDDAFAADGAGACTAGRADAGEAVDSPQLAIICGALAQRLARETMPPEANFFDAGGTSLTAVQLAGDLSRLLGTTVAAADIFAHPTARALAAHLARGGDGWSTAAAETLLLRAADTPPTGRPVVCLYPAGGLGWAYAGLVPHVPAGRAVLALQAPGMVGDAAPAASIHAAAAAAWERIDETFGADAAVDIVGWSVGGVIAQDMAAHRPARTGTLVLLDAYPATVWEDVPAPEGPELIRGVLAMAGIEQECEDPAEAAALLAEAPGVFAAFPTERITTILELIWHHAQIMREHRTRPADITAHMVQAERNPQAMDPHAWVGFVDELLVHPMPVDHPGMVSPEVFRLVGSLLGNTTDAPALDG
ncbi:hypothetical protein C1Y63_00895 [Corynebacterium sp. 13CS0277]|uniref:AMP-binding protein n=1 Tax=Corynebacterium sp. 13CS0277 TaxID=2071994 RepID=UPI000D02E333|nr:AMP-binding protein [Corynebacterium sp. 13CS0277]PRQ12383.1 hypothetical protein C1Y63_00895 [Corynebacterium sp. 13CS0277]